MAGAGVSVVLDRQVDLADLGSRLDAAGARYRAGTERPAEFEAAITTTTLIGGSYTGEERQFDVQWAAEPHTNQAFDEQWKRKITETFGLNPASIIYFGAWRNKRYDHQVLAELALHFARTYSGVIDFDGALIPWSGLSEGQRRDPTRVVNADWDDIATSLERSLQGLPGRIVAVPYDTGNGRRWATHIADVDFMDAWLSHPDFHMIK